MLNQRGPRSNGRMKVLLKNVAYYHAVTSKVNGIFSRHVIRRFIFWLVPKGNRFRYG